MALANRDFKYFYEDEVFRVTKKGSLQFGMVSVDGYALDALDVHLIQVIENAEFHSSDESSDEEEAVKAGQVISQSDADSQALLVPGQGGLVPQRD